MFKQSIKIISLLGLLLFSGAICSKQAKMPEEVTLKYWRVFEEEADFGDAFEQFKARYPYLTIEYRKLTLEEFEKAYFEAWAKGEGPDIFSIPNTYVGKYKDFITPLPSVLNITEVATKSRFGKKELVVTPTKVKTLTVQDLKAQYVDTVAADVVFKHKAKAEEEKEKIFGLPLSMDTLVLYYNKDLLNQAQISLPPQTWQDFYDDVKKITALDKDGNIITSGAALGTAENIPRAFDILSVLMMQNGATMVENNRVLFNTVSRTQSDYYPGLAAVDFYTAFANPDKDAYSWNENMPNALEAFTSSKVAFFLGYYYHLKQIKNLNPHLNFDLTYLPQVNLENKINYPNYWIETVSKNSTNPDLAWQLLLFLSKEDNLKKYLEATEKPTALKSLINEQRETYELRPFVEQALTAKSWYHGQDPQTAENLFKDLSTDILQAEQKVEELFNQTAEKIQLTL